MTLTVSGAAIDNHAAVASGLEAALSRLVASGKRIWLVGPIPEIGYRVPRSLYLNSLAPFPGIDIRPTVAEFNQRQSFVLPLVSRLAKTYDARVIWPHQSLCDENRCQVLKDGRPLYSDDQHLTRFASRSLSVLFDPVFNDLSPPKDNLTKQRRP